MTAIEDLLRGCDIVHGRIAIDRHPDGSWSATVAHFNGHMTHPLGDRHDDPVDALRVALVEDARKTGDLKRRYRDAPRAAAPPAAEPDEFEDLF